MEEHQDELAALEALNAGASARDAVDLYSAEAISLPGKVFTHAKLFELPGAIAFTRYFAGWADKNHGQTIEVCASKSDLSSSSVDKMC